MGDEFSDVGWFFSVAEAVTIRIAKSTTLFAFIKLNVSSAILNGHLTESIRSLPRDSLQVAPPFRPILAKGGNGRVQILRSTIPTLSQSTREGREFRKISLN
jgi:hypothetical protein